MVRENPGMSNVVTVKFEERILATLSKDEQSPSPEGMRTTCGPVPCCSTYQLMPSGVEIVDEVAMIARVGVGAPLMQKQIQKMMDIPKIFSGELIFS